MLPAKFHKYKHEECPLRRWA